MATPATILLPVACSISGLQRPDCADAQPFLLACGGTHTDVQPAMTEEMMDVTDQQGRRLQIPRAEYAKQMMDAARQNWENIQALRHFGPQLLSDGFPNEALEILDQAVKVSGGHVPDVYWRAAALTELNRMDEAATGFQEIYEDAAYPADQARALVGLARVRARQGQVQEATELLEQAVELMPEDPQNLLSLYGYHNERGEAQQGMEKVLNAVEKYPESAGPFRALAHIAASAKDQDELRRCATEALNRASKPEIQQDLLAEMTFLYGQLGMAQDIIDLLEPRVQQVHQPFALMNLAQALIDVGRKEHAKQLLEAIKKAAPPEMHPMVDQRLNLLAQA